MEYQTVPGYPTYEIPKDRRSGVKCRSKPKPRRGMGIASRGFVKGTWITPKAGRFRLVNPINGIARLFDPDNLYDACWGDAELIPVGRNSS